MENIITVTKKRIAVLTILCMIFTLMPATVSAANATDISGHWAQNTIQVWTDNNLVEGYPDGTFKPDSNVTRGEFITLVNRAFEYTGTAPISFTDVNQNEWYAAAIGVAVKAGYIAGYPDGTMRPESPISREEAATIIMRIKNLSANPSAVSVYTDAASIIWSKSEVGAVTVAKMMQGYPDGSFMPRGFITRAEIVTALDNAMHYILPVVVPPVDVIPPVDGGGGNNNQNVAVTAVVVTGTAGAVSVVNGDTLQMAAAVTPSNATNKTVTWSVAPTAGAGAGTATIDAATGILTGTGNGTVVVTATSSNSITGTVTIVVIDEAQPVISSINIVSSNADNTKAMNGDIITLTFASNEPVTALSTFKINGSNPDTFTCDVNNLCTATHLVDSGDAITGEPVTFQINVQNEAGIYSPTLEATSDSSSVTIIAPEVTVTNEATLQAALLNTNVTTIKLANNVTLADLSEFDYLTIDRAVILDGQDFALNKGILVEASNVIIKNLAITPSEFYPAWYYGVMIADVQGVEILDCMISGPAGMDAVGISDETGSLNTEFVVSGTHISNGWVGIMIDSLNTAASLTNNMIHDEKHAISITQADLTNLVITGNTISNPKVLEDAVTPGDGITVPASTLESVKSAIEAANTFVGVAPGNEVV